MAPSAIVSISVPIFVILLLSTLYQISSTEHLKDAAVSSSSYSNRNPLGLQRNSSQIPSCGEMVSRSQCSQNPNCRWCRSEALDDMCFSKTEAWRLPMQVFTCDS